MSLKDHFKTSDPYNRTDKATEKEIYKVSDDIVGVFTTHSKLSRDRDRYVRNQRNSLFDYKFDFSLRLLTIEYRYQPADENDKASKTSNQCSVVPFSQIDDELLIFLHEKLIELKGNPPPLPGRLNKPRATITTNKIGSLKK